MKPNEKPEPNAKQSMKRYAYIYHDPHDRLDVGLRIPANSEQEAFRQIHRTKLQLKTVEFLLTKFDEQNNNEPVQQQKQERN